MTSEEDEHKEVYTQFGVVASRISHFETALTSILLVVAKLEGRATTAGEYEQLVGDLQNKKTLGPLIQAVKKVVTTTDAVEMLLAEALKRRNFLMHHFFRERGFEFTTSQGRQRLLVELTQDQAHIFSAAKVADALCMNLAKNLGITPESVQEEAGRLRLEARQTEECK